MDVHTQELQGAWCEGARGDWTSVEDCVVVVRGLDVRGELIRSGERPKKLSVEAALRTTDELLCRVAAVYRLSVPSQFVGTLEGPFVLTTLNTALLDHVVYAKACDSCGRILAQDC
jgi:hypothetical protein